MSDLIILHTNDIHGRVEGLARVATLISSVRDENPGVLILYFDTGDVEEPSRRLSNLTKGAGMHRLLAVSGCDAAVVGNGAWMRYGPQVIEEHARSARYPLLAANLRARDGGTAPGSQPTALISAGGLRLGLIGMTTEMQSAYFSFYYDMRSVAALPLARDLAAALRQDGADGIVLLSHMGLTADRELAAGLQEDVSLIIGAHSHDLLPSGEWVGRVLIVQAGQYAEHLGRVDLTWDGRQLVVERAGVTPVGEDTRPSALILSEAAVVEAEIARRMDEIIGELAEPLDFACDRECGVADLMADVLRERMDAEVALVAAGQAFSGPLPAGPLRRSILWDVCSSTANPGLVILSGAQLAGLVARGRAPDVITGRPQMLRGQERGWMHLSGATLHDGELWISGQPVDAERLYRVAGTDFEFEPYGGYVDPARKLAPRYEVPTILREALEDYLAIHKPIRVTQGRIG